MKAHFVNKAENRQVVLSQDNEVVQQFWSLFEYLDQDNLAKESMRCVDLLNHSKEPDQTICINLPHFYKVCQENRQEVPSMKDLRKFLPSSVRRKFHEVKNVNSRLFGRTVRCFVFEK